LTWNCDECYSQKRLCEQCTDLIELTKEWYQRKKNDFFTVKVNEIRNSRGGLEQL
jgi:hypothetical protein